MKIKNALGWKPAMLVVFGILVLGGCSCSLKPESQKSQTGESGKNPPTENNLAKPGLLAMLMGKDGVKCQVKDEKGEYTVLTKGGKVRIEGINFMPITPPTPTTSPADQEAQAKPGTMISDGKMLWMWSGTEGISMNIEDAQKDLAQGDPGTKEKSPVQDWSAWAKQMEESGATYNCDASDVSDSQFVPPQEVKFQDMSQLFKNFGENMIPANLPGQTPQELPQAPPIKELP